MTNYTVVAYSRENTDYNGEITDPSRFIIDVFSDVDSMIEQAATYESEYYDEVECLINGVNISDSPDIEDDELERVLRTIGSRTKELLDAKEKKEKELREARRLAEEARQRAIRRTEWERLNKEFGRS